jgi:hypothetical protein
LYLIHLGFYHLSFLLKFNRKFNFNQDFKNLQISSHAFEQYLLQYWNYMGDIWAESMGGNSWKKSQAETSRKKLTSRKVGFVNF